MHAVSGTGAPEGVLAPAALSCSAISSIRRSAAFDGFSAREDRIWMAVVEA